MQMDILLWIVVLVLFALSIAGIFLPVLPDTILLWAGFLLYHFFIADPGAGLPASFWWGMVVFSILLYGADLLTNMYFVKKYGGSKWSSVAAAAGIFLGIFVFPPFGMIVLPFVFVVLVELLVQNQPFERAVKAGFGSLIGFLGSAVVKVVLQVTMIIWFFLAR
ncbi:membrane protein [Brevibacillus parabrevis]|uniref:Membrane protein n=2 Tax=Brevibacillus TaxID=55080 RepID=A0A4Y3PLL6_BREPA|nr:membrane protein [Brevibacillus parabrevis]